VAEVSDELTEIAEAVFDVARVLAAEFERAAAGIGLTKQQALVLRALPEPRTMAELAAIVGVDPSNLSDVVARLEELRLVVRRSAATDRRVRMVTLTAAGRRAVQRFLDDLVGATKLARLDAGQRRQLRDLLSLLRS